MKRQKRRRKSTHNAIAAFNALYADLAAVSSEATRKELSKEKGKDGK